MKSLKVKYLELCQAPNKPSKNVYYYNLLIKCHQSKHLQTIQQKKLLYYNYERMFLEDYNTEYTENKMNICVSTIELRNKILQLKLPVYLLLMYLHPKEYMTILGSMTTILFCIFMLNFLCIILHILKLYINSVL